MSMNSNPILRLTAKAAGAITERRFVGFDDLQVAVAGKAAKGVSIQDAVLDELTPITVLGTAVIESGGVFAAGDELVADTQGRAVKAANVAIAAGGTAVTSTAANGEILSGSALPEKRNGVAMEASGAAGEFVEILLIK